MLDRDTLRCLECEALLMQQPVTHVATIPDLGQILIDMWPDGRVTTAFRINRWETWGPPVVADRH